jgi:hypothetical protein
MKLDEVLEAGVETEEVDDDYSTEEDLSECLEFLGRVTGFFEGIIKSDSRKLTKGGMRTLKALHEEINEFLDQYET